MYVRMRCILRGVVTALGVLSAVGAGGQSPEGSRPERTRDTREQLAEIERRQQEALERFQREWSVAQNADERNRLDGRYQAEVRRAVEEAIALARANPASPGAGAALRFAVLTARGHDLERAEPALDILARDHARDPGMGKFAEQITTVYERFPAAESLIRAVLERSPDRNERGAACHALVILLENQAFTVRLLQTKPEELQRYRPLFMGYRASWEENFGKEATARFLSKNPSALEAEAEARLEQVVSEFGDVTDPLDRDHRSLASIARGELFALRHLAVGKVAPEIEGRDVDGQRFRLSDYRGNVVLLTFSGNWCAPCRSMYPEERALVKQRKNEAFALLGVNTDEKPESIRQSMASGEITWRCWLDGGTGGPITTRWGVQHFPTLYLIGPDGVIQRKLYRGDSLDHAIDDLLKTSALGKTPSRRPSPPAGRNANG